jgi:sulfate permease, SulP family
VVAAGCVSGLICVSVAISFAALVFSGDLTSYRPAGLGMALAGAVAIGVVMTLTSSYPGTVALPQDKTAAITALMVASIAASLPPGASGEVLLATVVTAIVVGSVLTAIAFLALGALRLGGLVRYVPYPVVGGFFAGTGWLLLDGGVGVLTGHSLHPAELPNLIEPAALVAWGPAAAFAVLLITALRRIGGPVVFPSFLIGATLLFYVGLLIGGVSVGEAGRAGWLLGPFPEGSLWYPLHLGLLSQADWADIVLGHAASLGTLVLVSVLSLLLYISGLEIAVRRDIDVNQEFKAAGLGNLASGAVGGLVGFHALSLSALSHRLGAESRVVGLIAASFSLFVLLAGAGLLSYVPNFLVGGILFFLGLDFLMEALHDARHKLPRADSAIIVLILVVVAAAGFLEGVAVGMVAGITLFIVNYSRISVAKHVLSGSTLRSNVDRSERQQLVLREQGDRLLVIKLQGFIFFGTASRLLERVRERMVDAQRLPLRLVLLDFKGVHGLDSSAVMSFDRMRQLAEAQNVILVLTSVTPAIRLQFAEMKFDVDDVRVLVFDDLDRGLEWCEEQALVWAGEEAAEALEQQLRRSLSPAVDSERLLGLMGRREFAAGTCIIAQGEPADDLYFVESGRVTVQLDLGDGRTVRLRTMGPGTVIGEIAFYLGGVRSASVIADRPTTVFRLSRAALDQLERTNPELASAFHQWIARLLAVRLMDTTSSLRAALE